MKQKKKFYLTIEKIILPKETKGMKGKIAKFLHPGLGKPVVVLILKNKEKEETYYLREGDRFEFTLTINYEWER